MKEPKIHGLPPLPEGHEFLLEGEKRREGMMVWHNLGAKPHWVEIPPRLAPLDANTIYCAPICKNEAGNVLSADELMERLKSSTSRNQSYWYEKTIRDAFVSPVSKSYADRQAEWVEKHGIKVGSKVRALREAESREDGWDMAWTEHMSERVGVEQIVCYISGKGLELSMGCVYPYFVLEPIHDIAPGHNPAGVTVYDVGELYRLMTEDEVRNPARPFDGKCERWFPVQGWIGGGAWGGDSLSYTYRVRKEPKQVPLTAEDWAGEGCWWVKMDGVSPMLVVCIQEDRLILAEGVREPYISLFKYYERSRDLITWTPCGKPE